VTAVEFVTEQMMKARSEFFLGARWSAISKNIFSTLFFFTPSGSWLEALLLLLSLWASHSLPELRLFISSVTLEHQQHFPSTVSKGSNETIQICCIMPCFISGNFCSDTTIM